MNLKLLAVSLLILGSASLLLLLKPWEQDIAYGTTSVEEHSSPPSGSGERHVIEMTSLGTYMAYLPPDYNTHSEKQYPVCLLLHGRGSSETSFGESISNALGRDGVIYIAVRGQYPSWQAMQHNGVPSYSGFPDIPDSDERKMTMRIYSEWIDSCLEDALKSYRCDPDQVYVLGYSQGGAAAIAYTVLHGKVRSCFTYAAYDPWVINEEVFPSLKERQTSFFLAHRQGDPVVSVNDAQTMNNTLRDGGIPVTTKYFDMQTHHFQEPVYQFARKWMEDVVRS